MLGLSKMSGLSDAEIKQQMELRPELIRNFFNSIDKKYGSIENFFQVEMGIGPNEIAILKKEIYPLIRLIFTSDLELSMLRFYVLTCFFCYKSLCVL